MCEYYVERELHKHQTIIDGMKAVICNTVNDISQEITHEITKKLSLQLLTAQLQLDDVILKKLFLKIPWFKQS